MIYLLTENFEKYSFELIINEYFDELEPELRELLLVNFNDWKNILPPEYEINMYQALKMEK